MKLYYMSMNCRVRLGLRKDDKMKTSRPSIRTVMGAPSWSFASDRVEVYLTRDGGHLAPIRFRTERGVIEPMAIAPWGNVRMPPDVEPVLRHLRGDFFCAPFGANADPWHGKRIPTHGETASGRWTSAELRTTRNSLEFRAKMKTRLMPGKVTKCITLKQGETNVYCRHLLEGFSTPLSIGHHAMLSFPAEGGPGFIALSSWREGRVCPKPFEAPENGGYSSLKIGASFRSLSRVPLATGGMADLSVYPAREGFEDLVMVSSRGDQAMAWTAVCFPKARYIWFSLKDPRTLASTVLWYSNGGRHYPPWNGRHRRVLGLEEVTGYFHYGQTQSAASNPLSRNGIATVLRFELHRSVAINYLMGVVSIPAGFDRVESIQPCPDGILIRAASGVEVRHSVALDFLGPSLC
jgi:hypothetical protein